jgi:hypothetical protein
MYINSLRVYPSINWVLSLEYRTFPLKISPLALANNISIIAYHKQYEDDLLRLLLELHDTHFHRSAPAQSIELLEEKNIEHTYKNYITEIQGNDKWKILLAVDEQNNMIGFIIGSIKTDEDLVKSHIGILEDWLVLPEKRRMGIGMKLYAGLEKWFTEKGCEHLMSATWHGNDSSINAHLKLGFYVSEVSFSKKLK